MMAEAMERMVSITIEFLAQSLSQEPAIRSHAEQKLEEIQKNGPSGQFLTLLLQKVLLGCDQTQPNRALSVDPNVRLMACIWLKNFFKKHWRSSALTASEKQQLRQLILTATVQEPLTLVAAQLNLVVAQMARCDFPNNWGFDMLFAPLLTCLQPSANGSQLDEETNRCKIRSIAMLLRVVKELAARRLMMHRKQFAAMSVQVLPVLLPFWNDLLSKTTHLIANELANNVAQAAQVAPWLEQQCQLLLLTSRIISAIFLNAFRDLMMQRSSVSQQNAQQQELVNFTFHRIHEHLEALLTCRHALQQFLAQTASCNAIDGEKLMECFDKITIRLAKTVVETQKAHAIEFRSFLQPFAEFFWRILSANKSLEATQTKLLIQSITFFNNVVSCRLYKVENLGNQHDGMVSKVITSTGEVEVGSDMVLEAQSAIQRFFETSEPAVSVLGDASVAPSTATRIQNLVHLTLTQLLCMTLEEHEQWQDSPEDFYVASEHATSEESVRVSAENLFLSVLQSFPQPAISILMSSVSMASQWLQQLVNSSQSLPGRDHELLVVDAILLALGLSCYDLHEAFEFEPWFLSSLVPFLVQQQQQNLHKMETSTKLLLLLLLNRIVWLVTCWLAQLSSNIRSPLYEVLLNEAFFVGRDAKGDGEVDMHMAILSLRVIQTMISMLSDWGFEQDKFAPFARRLIECCFVVFALFEELEAKVLCLTCLETLIDVMGKQMLPFVPLICEPLPAIWNQSSDSLNMIRSRILSLLTALLHAIQDDEDDKLPSETSAEALANKAQLISMCLQIVAFATNSGDPHQVFLMENGLELWKQSLECMGQGSEYTEQIHLLFGNAVSLMQRDYEHVQIVMELVETYVGLGQLTFWSQYHEQVGSMLECIVGNTKAEATIQLASTTERIITLLSQHPQGTSSALSSLVPLLSKMMASCRSFANKDMDREPESVILGFLNVFARMIVHQMEFFGQILSSMGGGLDSLVVVIDLMVEKYFALRVAGVSALRKRLWALALVTLLSIGEAVVLERIGPIMDICADVIQEEEFETQKKANGKAAQQDANAQEEEDDQEEEETKGSLGRLRVYQKQQQQEARRKRQDPVFQVVMTAFVCGKLNELSTRLGAARFQELLQNHVDQSIVHKLQQLSAST